MEKQILKHLFPLERRQFVCRVLSTALMSGLLLLSFPGFSHAVTLTGSALTVQPGSRSVEHSEYFKLHQASQLLQSGKDAAALPYLIEAIETNPGNLLALFHLGNVYLELAKTSDLPAQAMVYLDQSEQAFERVVDLNPELSLTYFKLGKIALLRGDTVRARSLYEEGLKQDPDNAALIFNMARVYDQSREMDKAIAYYQKTLAVDPDFIYAYNNLGLIYEEMKDYKNAEKVYKQALAKSREYNLPRLNLGNLYASTGRYEDAKKVLTEALKFEPDNAWGHYYMGNLHLRMNQYEQATAYYEKAAALNPKYPTTYYLLAVSLTKQKRMEEALQASMQYIQLAPEGEFSKEMKNLILSVKMVKAGGFSFTSSEPANGVPAQK